MMKIKELLFITIRLRLLDSLAALTKLAESDSAAKYDFICTINTSSCFIFR